jgi:hypothetical protein
MLQAQPEAAHVLSLWERPLPPAAAGAPSQMLLGACYCDCASNLLMLGQWCAHSFHEGHRALIDIVVTAFAFPACDIHLEL